MNYLEPIEKIDVDNLVNNHYKKHLSRIIKLIEDEWTKRLQRIFIIQLKESKTNKNATIAFFPNGCTIWTPIGEDEHQDTELERAILIAHEISHLALAHKPDISRNGSSNNFKQEMSEQQEIDAWAYTTELLSKINLSYKDKGLYPISHDNTDNIKKKIIELKSKYIS